MLCDHRNAVSPPTPPRLHSPRTRSPLASLTRTKKWHRSGAQGETLAKAAGPPMNNPRREKPAARQMTSNHEYHPRGHPSGALRAPCSMCACQRSARQRLEHGADARPLVHMGHDSADRREGRREGRPPPVEGGQREASLGGDCPTGAPQQLNSIPTICWSRRSCQRAPGPSCRCARLAWWPCGF